MDRSGRRPGRDRGRDGKFDGRICEVWQGRRLVAKLDLRKPG